MNRWEKVGDAWHIIRIPVNGVTRNSLNIIHKTKNLKTTMHAPTMYAHKHTANWDLDTETIWENMMWKRLQETTR